MKPMGNQQLLGQRLAEITFIPKEFSEEACDQLGDRTPIINVAWRQAS